MNIIILTVYFPLKTGFLFSWNAFRASILSSVGIICNKTTIKIET